MDFGAYILFYSTLFVSLKMDNVKGGWVLLLSAFFGIKGKMFVVTKEEAFMVFQGFRLSENIILLNCLP